MPPLAVAHVAQSHRPGTPAHSISLAPKAHLADSACSRVYVGIALSDCTDVSGERACVVVVTDGRAVLRCQRSSHSHRVPLDALLDTLLDKLDTYADVRRHKIDMIALSAAVPPAAHCLDRFFDRTWLALDALPFLVPPASSTDHFSLESRALAAVTEAVNCLEPSPHATVRIEFDRQRRVLVDANGRIQLGSLRLVERVSPPGLFARFRALAAALVRREVRVGFFSATPRGGGVALMRHALMRLWSHVGVDARWYVPPGDPNVFNVTKRKFHNVLQGVAPASSILTRQDKQLYQRWTAWYFSTLWKDADGDGSEFLNGFDVVVIDDPQVLGLVPVIRRLSPRTKIIYRSHIQIRSDLVDQGAAQQRETWDFLYEAIRQVDLFVAHPLAEFVPQVVKHSLPVVYMPPCTAPLDGLNKPIPSRYISFYRRAFNLAAEVALGRTVDWGRGYILQIARFDPSKGIPDLVEAYRVFRVAFVQDPRFADRDPPQLVLTGHAAIDDPDGASVVEALYDQLSTPEFDELRDDVFAVRAPSSDRLLDTILRGADVVCQVSAREGYEIKVTEAIDKGKWVVVTDAGGLPLQLRDGVDGRLVAPNDPHGISEALVEFYASNDVRSLREDDTSDATIAELLEHDDGSSMSRSRDGHDADADTDAARHSTLANATMWEYLFLRLLAASDDVESRRVDEDGASELRGLGIEVGTGLESLNGQLVWSVVKDSISKAG
ncbi:hypothetical protein JCM11491_004060 [Sporobolomyces phaffii]